MVKEGDSPMAEGSAEFTADPSSFMHLLGLDATPLGESKKMSTTTTNVEDPTRRGPTPSDTEAMKDILTRFHASAETEVDLTLRSDKSLQRAMITEANVDKEWHIVLVESSVKPKSYTISNHASHKSFFEDVALYEAAIKICSLLERGLAVNSTKIQKVLYYDNLYDNHFSECRNIKRLHKKAMAEKNNSRTNILSDKFEQSREKALNAKSQINHIR